MRTVFNFLLPNAMCIDIQTYYNRYMKWQLKDGVGLVVRCEYDAVLPPPNKPTYVTIKALNEWDSKVQ